MAGKYMAKNKWDKIDELNKKLGFVPTDDGFTVDEYAERYQLNRTTASHRLVGLTKLGFLKAGWRYSLDTNNRRRKIRVYVTP